MAPSLKYSTSAFWTPNAEEPPVRMRSPFLSTLAAWLMLLAPVNAFAQGDERNVAVQDRQRPEYDAQGRRLGAFTLNASLGLGVAATDNLRAEVDALAKDDVIFYAAPLVSLSSNWSRNALDLSAGARTESHQDFSSENADAVFARAYGRLDVGSDSNVFGTLRVSREPEPRTAPDAEVLTSPVEYSRREASVGAQHTLNRFQFSAVLGRDDWNYHDAGLVDQDFRDRTEDFVTGRVAMALSPRISVLANVRADQREYDNQPSLNSDGRTIGVGLRLALTDLLAGEFTVGQYTRDYDSGQSVDGVAISGDVNWFVTPLTTISLSARRDVEETAATTASTYVATNYGVRVGHELRRNIILTGGISRLGREFDTIDRQDDATFADIGLEYLINRRVALVGGYERVDSQSSGLAADRDFEVNRLTAGVRLAL